MLGADFVEDVASRTGTTFARVFETLANALARVSFRGNVQKPLVCFGILHHGFRFSVHGEDQGPSGLFETADDLGGIASKRGQGLNIFGDIKHSSSTPTAAPLKVP
jgi:hypothetical protein